MSSMLRQAIIDAEALRESAIKNAEAVVVEKYSEQIKQAVNSLLEQEDPFAEEEEGMPEELPAVDPMVDPMAMGAEEELSDPVLDQVPPATAEDLPEPSRPDGAPVSDSDVIVFDLPDLVQAIEAAEEETGVAPEADETHEELAGSPEMAAAVEASPEAASPLAEENDLEIDDQLIEEILESLKVDIDPAKSGWAGTPSSIVSEYEDMLLAKESDDKVEEENKELRKRVKELEESINTQGESKEKLIQENNKFRETLLMLKEKIEVVNVSNAKLLYINQALENPSLNERQRRKVVEAISKAETTKEAKVIYETLQGAVGSTEKKPLPKSLSEAVSRNSSLIISSHRKSIENNSSPGFSERMQRLAGITKN